MNTNNSSDVAQKKVKHLAARQPELGAWLAELTELHHAYCEGTLTNKDFRLFGAGLVIEKPDEQLLIDWLGEACKALKLNFEVLDVSASPDLLERLSQEKLKLSVKFLKSGDWLFERCTDESAYQTRTSLIEILKKKDSLSIFVTYSHWYSEVAECLRFEGLFDRYFRWAEHSVELLAKDFIRDVGKNYFERSLINDKLRLGRLLLMDYRTKRQQGLLKIGLQRKSRELGRPVDWKDVISMAINGTGKGHVSVDQINSRHVAVHEAGHAVMCIESSGGENLPEYVSILPNRYSIGQTFEGVNWGYKRTQFMTLKQCLGRIKNFLAGRAAEELIFGCSDVVTGLASEDLEEASRLSYQLIAKDGLPSRSDQGEDWRTNLLVVEDDAPDAQKAVAYADSARLISDLYDETKRILEKKRPLVIAISDALVESKVLFENDIRNLIRERGV